jgi:hypothetical protein
VLLQVVVNQKMVQFVVNILKIVVVHNVNLVYLVQCGVNKVININHNVKVVLMFVRKKMEYLVMLLSVLDKYNVVKNKIVLFKIVIWKLLEI